MQPEDLPFTTTRNGRRAHYLSRTGWGVFPKEPHAGDTILPEEHSLLPEKTLLILDTDEGHRCDFCDHDYMVEERGVVGADYELRVYDPESDETEGEPVAMSCHSCLEGAPVHERDVRPYTPGDVYTPNPTADTGSS